MIYSNIMAQYENIGWNIIKCVVVQLSPALGRVCVWFKISIICKVAVPEWYPLYFQTGKGFKRQYMRTSPKFHKSKNLLPSKYFTHISCPLYQWCKIKALSLL